jgi:hypothetical protein
MACTVQSSRLHPEEYVEIGSGEPIGSENLVEFHLLYSGPLHSAGQENPRKEKHAIRKVFHSQLRRLWETHPNLRYRAVKAINASILRLPSRSLSLQELRAKSREHGSYGECGVLLGPFWDRRCSEGPRCLRDSLSKIVKDRMLSSR